MNGSGRTLRLLRRGRDSNPRDLAVGGLVNRCNSHYATSPSAEGTGLEPASPYGRQFSRLVPYHSEHPSTNITLLLPDYLHVNVLRNDSSDKVFLSYSIHYYYDFYLYDALVKWPLACIHIVHIPHLSLRISVF